MELDSNIPLVGREEEVQVLLDLRRRIMEEDSSVGTLTLMVQGGSGSGKTALCQQVLQQQHGNNNNNNNNNNNKVFSIAGKFDQHQKKYAAAPYSALVQALDSLGQQILQSVHDYHGDDETKNEELVATLRQCLSRDACLLVQLIPSFQELMRTNSDESNHVIRSSIIENKPPIAPDYKDTLYGKAISECSLIDSDSADESDEKEDYSSTFLPPMLPSELQPTSSLSPKQKRPPKQLSHENNNRRSSLPLAPPPARLKSHLSFSLQAPPPITRLQTQQSYMTLASERLAVAFRVFLAEFCSNQRPLILLVDDLQWADVSSINFLAMLAKNACGITNMMMVLCFRDKDDDHHADHEKVHSQDQDIPQLFKSKLNTNTNDNISELQLDNLTLQGVQEMLAKILRHALDDTKLLELATIVHRKTHGNPYFVQEFLRLLVREEILTYNFATISWQWHATVVQETDVSDNVVSVVLKRMESLPASVRRLLTLASFVGYYASTNLLIKLASLPSLVVEHAGTARPAFDDKTTVSGETKRCEDDGILLLVTAEKEGFVEFIDGGTTLVFSHDRVQQVAYASATNRDQLHWNIGQVVYESFVKGDKAKKAYGDRFVFVAADQLNRGSSCISTEEQRLEVMRLNFYASQLAANKSSIVLRADFLLKAIALSKETDWKGDDETYQIVLEIYSKSIEVESSRGNLTTSQILASTVLQHARKPEDARGAKTGKSHAYIWSMQWNQAIQEAREVLDLCGETLAPSNPRDVEKECQKLKRLVKGLSDDDLLNLPAMTDELKISAMKILKLAVPVGFASDANYASLCFLKMMELTMRYGHLVETGGFALSGFGRVLANMGKNEKQQAYRFSQLSLKVAADRVSIPGTALNVYGYLSHMQQPTGGSLEPTLEAYRAGLEVGDMTFGGICVSLYAMLYVMNGLPLKSYIEDMKQISGELKLCHQDFCNLYLVPGLQLALSLSSSPPESFPMTWAAISHDGYFPEGMDIAAVTEGQPPQALLCYFGAFEAYVHNDWDGVRLRMKNVYAMTSFQFPGHHFINFFFDLIDGLASVVLFQRLKKRKYKAQARQAMTRLESASKDGSSDACLFQQLLGAAMTTIAWPRVPTDTVKAKFDASIAQASKAGFLHLAAIGHERLGEYMAAQRDHDWSKHYLQKACSLYIEWGAHRKAQQMQRSFNFIDGSSDASGSSFRGRRRSISVGSLSRRGSSRDLEKEIAAALLDEGDVSASDFDLRSNSSAPEIRHSQ